MLLSRQATTVAAMEVERNNQSQQRRQRMRTLQRVQRQEQQNDVPYQRRRLSPQLPPSMPPLPPSLANNGNWSFCVEIANDDNPTKTAEKQRPTAIATTNTKERQSFIAVLQRYSTIASWLCLIDCTLLPLITVVTPLLGLTTMVGPERVQWLHAVGDYTTLYFLLPVGAMSTAMNYYNISRNSSSGGSSSSNSNRSGTSSKSRRQQWPWILAAMGALGWTMVAIANSYSLPGIGHLQVFHVFHRGVWHRIFNGIGCLCLLGSNQLSVRRFKHASSRGGGGSGDGKRTEESCCILHDSWNVKAIQGGKDQGSDAWRRQRRRRHPHLSVGLEIV